MTTEQKILPKLRKFLVRYTMNGIEYRYETWAKNIDAAHAAFLKDEFDGKIPYCLKGTIEYE